MVVVGVVGICVFAEMAGRVAAVSGRATFEIIRERLGPRVGLANLAGSFLINLLTLTAEIGGVALALQLASSVGLVMLDPRRGLRRVARDLAGGSRSWRTSPACSGLTLVVFAVAVFMLGPDWGELADQALSAGAPADDRPPRTGTTRSRCSARR